MEIKEKRICKYCGKEFTLIITRFPCYLEGRNWDTFYVCPHCHKSTDIHLQGNEDVQTK